MHETTAQWCVRLCPHLLAWPIHWFPCSGIPRVESPLCVTVYNMWKVDSRDMDIPKNGPEGILLSRSPKFPIACCVFVIELVCH